MSASSSLPTRADAARTIDPGAEPIVVMILDGLDANEHMRSKLAAFRVVARTEDARARIDVALGRLSGAYRQLKIALRDVERAGGAL